MHNVNWDMSVSDNAVVFSTYSTDPDAGYPGALNVAMKLMLSPISGELKIEYSGMSTRKTPIDISNNVLINLAGHKKGIEFLLININCNVIQLNVITNISLSTFIHQEYMF